MTVASMGAQMSACELDDWRDYEEAEAAFSKAVHIDKMDPEVAARMVWSGPKERT
jgi:hypothetical protein